MHEYTYNGDIYQQNYLWDFTQNSDGGFLFVGDFDDGNGQDVWLLKTKKNGCIDDDCSTLVYGAFLGEEEQVSANSSFRVFPNPSNGEFTISWNKENQFDQIKVRVVNAIGKTVLEESVSNSPSSKAYKLAIAQSGVYVITILSQNNILHKSKLILHE